MKNLIKKKDKVQEWADKSVNCCTGCSNNCLYCYARGMAIRFGQVAEDQWSKVRIRADDVARRHRNYGETVMFPTSHDIVPENLFACLRVLKNLLVEGNEVLIVTKPNLDCVTTLCKVLKDFKEQILFRFTIGAMDNKVLSFWEPGATTYEERKESLQYAFDAGFETSVSMEPMLDSVSVVGMMNDLLPYVTETVWLGKLNYLGRLKVDSEEMSEAVERIKAGQADDRIIEIYKELGHIPQIRWKGSIKKTIKLYEGEGK